mmetsp:Transcript_21343/g.31877  ORF Transcript_21343/g.31877 Transcript_21343/m.31877 type:complete len:153 (-) Transcript_21343:1139-1597(-)
MMRKAFGLAAFVLLICCLNTATAFISVQSHCTQSGPIQNRECALTKNNRLYRPTFVLQLGAANSGSTGDDTDEDDSWGASAANIVSDEDSAIPNEEYQGGGTEGISEVNKPPERDLFIPIFTLVSLVGFFGAYAYESFRLYANGELYLPWDN